MDKERAVNIAVGCVMASGLSHKEKFQVIEILREMESGKRETCEWSQDEDGVWGCSKCECLWEFDEGGPKDNFMYYCPECGREIAEETCYQDDKDGGGLDG